MKPTITNLRCAVVVALAVTTVAITCTAASAQSTEGVKVRGRWTIDVRNQDGTLASHHEFDNALVVNFVGGSSVLAGFMGRFFRYVEQWQVRLIGPQGGDASGPCLGTSGQEESCLLLEKLTPGSPGLGDLTLTLPMQGALPAGTMELAGFVRTASAVPIHHVAANLTMCRGDNCSGGRFGMFFSKHQLASPIAVTPNQVIEVRVVFSFS
jgi:hypothetical protein